MREFPTYKHDIEFFKLRQFYSHKEPNIHSEIFQLMQHYCDKYKKKNTSRMGKHEVERFASEVYNFRNFTLFRKFIYLIFHWNIREKDRAVRALDVYKKVDKIHSLLEEMGKIWLKSCRCPLHLEPFQKKLSNRIQPDEIIWFTQYVTSHYSPLILNQKVENIVNEITELGYSLLYDDMSFDINTFFHSDEKLTKIKNNYLNELISHFHKTPNFQDTNIFHSTAKEIRQAVSECWKVCQEILDSFIPDDHAEPTYFGFFFNKEQTPCKEKTTHKSETAHEDEAAYKDESNINKDDARESLSKFFAIQKNAPDNHFRKAYKHFMLRVRSDTVTQGHDNLNKVQEINNLMDISGLRK